VCECDTRRYIDRYLCKQCSCLQINIVFIFVYFLQLTDLVLHFLWIIELVCCLTYRIYVCFVRISLRSFYNVFRLTTHYYALRTMAKTVTPEIIEAIVTRVIEKFTDVLSAITTNLTAMIRDTFNTQLTILNARVDAIEGEIAQNGSTGSYRGDVVYDTSHSSSSPLPNDLSASVIQGLLMYEKEKEDIRRRARNVIITGLPRQNSTPDFELADSFCENHLTVKPHIASTKRVGKTVMIITPSCVPLWKLLKWSTKLSALQPFCVYLPIPQSSTCTLIAT
jgi:hypothetical protein